MKRGLGIYTMTAVLGLLSIVVIAVMQQMMWQHIMSAVVMYSFLAGVIYIPMRKLYKELDVLESTLTKK